MHVTCVVGPYFWLENFSASLHYFTSLLCVTNFNYFLIKMKFNKSYQPHKFTLFVTWTL